MKRFFLLFLLFATTVTAQEFTLSPEQPVTDVLNQVRAWHTQNPGKTATVNVLAGEHFLKEKVTLTSADSHTKFLGQDGAMFTRGKKITGWTKDANGRFVTKIDAVKNGAWWFESLYVNGRSVQRARTPNADAPDGRYYHYIREAYEDGPTWAFHPRAADVPLWKNAIGKILSGETKLTVFDVHVQFYHSWESSKHRVAAYDAKENLVKLTGPAKWELGRWGEGLRYAVEGIPEALDAPGEFLLLRDGTLTYLPKPGETLENTEFYAPDNSKTFADCGFFVIAGTLEKRAENITLEHLTFLCDVFRLPENGWSDGQSAVSAPASLYVNFAKDITFRDLAVRGVGGYAIQFYEGCENGVVEKCFLEDMGAGGVRIGAAHGTSLTEERLTHHCKVHNCIVRRYGLQDAGGIGVWMGHSSDNIVTHNDISDGFYTGVSVGWVWGYRESKAVRNTIEFNHIHHIGKGVLSDMGGVYSLGISPGTSVSNNTIHHVYSYNRYGRGGWGLYTDEGSSDMRFENNLVYRTHTGTFHQHYGSHNVLRNNILAFSLEEQLKRSRPEEHLSFTMKHNIILFDDTELATLLNPDNKWVPEYAALRHNLYWNLGGADKVTFQGETFDQWQKRGMDERSIVADPHFVDAKNDDFRFTEASKPVLAKMGFVPFDFTLAGVLKDDVAWRKKAEDYAYPRVVFTPDAPVEPLDLTDSFESARKLPLRKVAGIRYGDPYYKILEENGNHFVRIIDNDTPQFSFAPCFDYQPRFTDEGTAKVAFDVRLSDKAHLMLEFRDKNAPYRTGPSLHWKEGKLSANGKPAGEYSPNAWFHVEITCPVGEHRGDVYTLKITCGEKSQVTEVKLGNPNWKLLESLTFAALETNPATLDLDNVEIHFQRK